MTTPDEVAALLPCPFCGGKAKLITDTHGPDFVNCVECGVAVHPDMWNRRASLSPPAGMVGETPEMDAEIEQLLIELDDGPDTVIGGAESLQSRSRRAIRSIERRLRAALPPAGMVMVPREPTHDILWHMARCPAGGWDADPMNQQYRTVIEAALAARERKE